MPFHGKKPLPISHHEFNLVSISWILSAVIQFGKSLLSEELRERIIMHPNMEEVANHVKPASILPAEAGGLVPMSIMIDQWKSVLEERREAILSFDQMECDMKN